MEDTRPPARESVEFTRIVAFTDGVFAIAITLLVLSLDVPDDVAAADLDDYLVDSWRQFFAYFLSFAVIGRFWISHHEMFSLLHDFDRRLIVVNLVYLSLIVLIPFPTELLGDYGEHRNAIVLYAAVVGAAALLTWWMLRDGLRRRLVHPGARAGAARMASGVLVPGAVFCASVPVAFLSPVAAQLLWLALAFQWLPAWVARRR